MKSIKTKKVFTIAFIAACVFAFSNYAYGTNSAIVLQPLSAKGIAMGEAFCTESGSLESIHYNIAGTALIDAKKLGITYHRGIADDNFGIISYSIPREKAALTTGFVYYNSGKVDLINNRAVLLKTVTGKKDYLFNIGYAKNVFSWTLFSHLSYGAQLKLLNSKLIDKFSATAVLADAGFIISRQYTSFGFTLQNIGTGIKYNNKENNSPIVGRTGFSFKSPMLHINLAVLASGDKTKQSIGVKYSKLKSLDLLAGYKFGYDLDGLSFGLSYKINKKMEVTFAVSSMGEIGYRQLISLLYNL